MERGLATLEAVEGHLVLEEDDLRVCLAADLRADGSAADHALGYQLAALVHQTSALEAADDQAALADFWVDRIAVCIGEFLGRCRELRLATLDRSLCVILEDGGLLGRWELGIGVASHRECAERNAGEDDGGEAECSLVHSGVLS